MLPGRKTDPSPMMAALPGCGEGEIGLAPGESHKPQGSRYDVGEVPLRVLFRRRPPEPGVTVSDHRALQRLFRD